MSAAALNDPPVNCCYPMDNVTLQNSIHETIYFIKERVPKSIEPPQDIAEKFDTLEKYGQI